MWFLFAAAMGMVAVACSPANGGEVLVQFYSQHCPPCREMKPVVEELLAEGYPVQGVDVESQPDMAERYGVSAIPCFILLKDGKEHARAVGRVDRGRLEGMFSSATRTREREKVKVHERGRELVSLPAPPRPTPAWRYEEPRGHRAAVVRIYCCDSATTRSIGSGAAVRWGGRVVVLTARHVVQDAAKVMVETCRKTVHRARVIAVDAVWDCSVLEFVDAAPQGVAPAEVVLGDEAMQSEGDRLETCGYGSDGRLACSTGLFLGYKRSTQMLDGPDDWMAVSGRARQGDSGGPVFDAQGRVVGVLWGTDGEAVYCVQAGRVHRVLDAAMGKGVKPQAFVATRDAAGSVVHVQPLSDLSRPMVPVILPQDRRPTPPVPAAMPGPVVSSGPTVETQTTVEVQASAERPRVLPYRGGEDRRNAETAARLAEISRILAEQQRQATAAQTQPPADAQGAPEMKAASPLAAGLCALGAVLLGFVVYFAAVKQE